MLGEVSGKEPLLTQEGELLFSWTSWAATQDPRPRRLLVGPSAHKESTLTFLLLLGDDAVNFIRLRDVQLGPVCHFLKNLLCSASVACLPRGWLGLVPFLKLPFKNGPGLEEEKKHMKQAAGPRTAHPGPQAGPALPAPPESSLASHVQPRNLVGRPSRTAALDRSEKTHTRLGSAFCTEVRRDTHTHAAWPCLPRTLSRTQG